MIGAIPNQKKRKDLMTMNEISLALRLVGAFGLFFLICLSPVLYVIVKEYFQGK
jgi:hypothetical protein